MLQKNTDYGIYKNDTGSLACCNDMFHAVNDVDSMGHGLSSKIHSNLSQHIIITTRTLK